jgi:hypothetical protein
MGSCLMLRSAKCNSTGLPWSMVISTRLLLLLLVLVLVLVLLVL